MRKAVRDEWGNEVSAGDIVTFSYGIPPVGVKARVKEIDGILWAMTPGHRPDRCKLHRLRAMVGCFYKDTPAHG